MGTENRAEGPEKAAMRGQARTWSRRRRSKLCFIRRRCTWEQSGQCVPEPEAVSPDGENHEVPRTLGKTCPWHLTENRSFWSGKKKNPKQKTLGLDNHVGPCTGSQLPNIFRERYTRGEDFLGVLSPWSKQISSLHGPIWMTKRGRRWVWPGLLLEFMGAVPKCLSI